MTSISSSVTTKPGVFETDLNGLGPHPLTCGGEQLQCVLARHETGWKPLVLNHLKEYECTAPIMGRRVFWLVAILLVLPFTASANSETRMTVEGMAWFDCDASWATIQDSQGNEIANGSEFTALDSGNHTFFVENNSRCQSVIPDGAKSEYTFRPI